MKHMRFDDFDSAKGFPIFSGFNWRFNIYDNLNYSCIPARHPNISCFGRLAGRSHQVHDLKATLPKFSQRHFLHEGLQMSRWHMI